MIRGLARATVVRAGRDAWLELFPGVAIAVLVGMAAAFLGSHYKGSMLLFALLLGMALNFLIEDARLRPGIQFVAGTVLRVGVALLGLRLTLDNVSSLGVGMIAALMVGVVATVLVSVMCARALGLDRDLGLLVGGATAICGASAALAIASVLPHREGHEKRTTLAVIGVTALSTLAMIVYPAITGWLGFDASRAGIFIGATIHDVAQVVGAGYSLSPVAGDAATITKLIRVALLMPVLVAIALMVRGGGSATASGAPLIPWFAVVFAMLMLANSTGFVPGMMQSAATYGSQACLVVAIAAVGVKTSLRDVASLGWRPVLLLALVTGFLAVIAATYLHTLH